MSLWGAEAQRMIGEMPDEDTPEVTPELLDPAGCLYVREPPWDDPPWDDEDDS